jgi:8-oxo-dGTP diphosphatase
VRTRAFEPRPALSWEQLRAERVHELRWWTIAELAAAQREKVWFAPKALPDLLADLVAEGPPATPLDVGV